MRIRGFWLAGAGLFLAACASAASERAEPTVDCGAILTSATSSRYDLRGFYRGEARAQGSVTPIELLLEEDGAWASLPERAQYDAPVRVISPAPDVLCVSAAYQSSVWTLRRQGRSLSGQWVGRDFNADLQLRAAQAPPRIGERPLDFVSADGARLAGTLVTPNGRGPFTTVVWVHGSAPTTRDTWFYRGRARMLAREGIASLIWDKRGSGASTGEQSWSIDRLTLDAQAAIAAARDAPEVADDRVVLAGASQGGWIAPRVAADNPWLAGVFVIAAPGITIAEQNVYSFEQALRRENVPEDLTTRAVALVRASYEYYRTGEGYEALRARYDDPANATIVSEQFFRNMLFQGGELPGPEVDQSDWSFMFVDYLQYWRRIDRPVLAMWGADDNEVPPTLSRDRVGEALAGRGDHELHVYDDATHSLYVNRDAGEPADWERTAPGFREDLLTWLARRR
jgi:pimeloyl-ACP methyl ester carboxylesterase